MARVRGRASGLGRGGAVVSFRENATVAAIGAVAAPRLRSKRVVRRITTVDENGNPKRVVTDEELAISLLRRQGVEFDLPGTAKLCAQCAAIFRTEKSGSLCAQCVKSPRCACGASVSPGSLKPGQFKARDGAPASCRACRNRKISHSKTKPRLFCDTCHKELGRLPPAALKKRCSLTCQGCINKMRTAAARPRAFCACGAVLTKTAFSPSAVRQREGRPPLCRSCASSRLKSRGRA